MWCFFRYFLFELFDYPATDFKILQMEVSHLSEFLFWAGHLVWSFEVKSGAARMKVCFEHICRLGDFGSDLLKILGGSSGGSGLGLELLLKTKTAGRRLR